MTEQQITELINILTDRSNLFQARVKALEWARKQTIVEPVEDTRTKQQHKALFTWFGQIEKVAEENGTTFNAVMQHTHQVRVTKDGLHALCKVLIEALWSYTSTKQIKKHKELDIIIDHFVDLFSKEGLELPPFPSREKSYDYPEYDQAPNFDVDEKGKEN